MTEDEDSVEELKAIEVSVAVIVKTPLAKADAVKAALERLFSNGTLGRIVYRKFSPARVYVTETPPRPELAER